MLPRRMLIAIAVLLFAALPALAYDEVVLKPRPGVTESVFVMLRPDATRNVILFTGSEGG